MPVSKHACYFVACDVCGKKLDAGDLAGVMHFDSAGEARDIADESEWTVYKKDIWCDKCQPLCICGHTFTMHESGEDVCQEETCSCLEFVRRIDSEQEPD